MPNPLLNRLIASGQAPSGPPVLPSGALGVWYADTYQALPRPVIPNAMQPAVPLSANLLNGPRRLFSNTILYSASMVDDAATAPDGSNEASTLLAAGDFSVSSRFATTFPAGTYTVAVSAKRNTGTDQQFAFSSDNTATRSAVKTATSVWQRFSYTFTKVSNFNVGIVLLCSKDGVTGANLQLCDFELFAGSSDLGPSVCGGHLYLGSTAYDTTPSYAAGELDLSTGGWGVIQLPASSVLTEFTAIALTRKVAAGSAYHSFLCKIQDFVAFTAYTEASLQPTLSIGGTAISNAPGLWILLNQGYHCQTQRADAAGSNLFLDDLKMFTGAATTGATVRDFFVGMVDNLALTAGEKISAIALYPHALSDAEVRQAYAALKNRAAQNSIAVTAASRILVAEGDSITSTASPVTYPNLYGTHATTPVLGTNLAVSGSRIADLITRKDKVKAVIPPGGTGCAHFILTVLIGANDSLSTQMATYLADVAAYLDEMRATGFIVVLCTLLPQTAAGFNANRATANTEFRLWTTGGSMVPGIHADAIIDFDTDPTMGINGNGSTTGPWNTTYYADGLHPTQAGQNILETVARPVLNAL